jgi:hypothetical protein
VLGFEFKLVNFLGVDQNVVPFGVLLRLMDFRKLIASSVETAGTA